MKAHFLAVVLAVATATPVWAQSWHGSLRCGEVAGHVGRGRFDLSVEQSGNRLSFSRPMRTADGGLSNSAETGTGTVNGDAVDLRGLYTDRGDSEASHYSGRIVGGTMRLNGEQVWTYGHGQETAHRICRATLQH